MNTIIRILTSRIFAFISIMVLTMLAFELLVLAITGEGIPIGR